MVDWSYELPVSRSARCVKYRGAFVFETEDVVSLDLDLGRRDVAYQAELIAETRQTDHNVSDLADDTERRIEESRERQRMLKLALELEQSVEERLQQADAELQGRISDRQRMRAVEEAMDRFRESRSTAGA